MVRPKTIHHSHNTQDNAAGQSAIRDSAHNLNLSFIPTTHQSHPTRPSNTSRSNLALGRSVAPINPLTTPASATTARTAQLSFINVVQVNPAVSPQPTRAKTTLVNSTITTGNPSAARRPPDIFVRLVADPQSTPSSPTLNTPRSGSKDPLLEPISNFDALTAPNSTTTERSLNASSAQIRRRHSNESLVNSGSFLDIIREGHPLERPATPVILRRRSSFNLVQDTFSTNP